MATTHKGHKILEGREPKIEEDRKRSLFINGRKTSKALNQIWDELAKFRYGEIVKFSKKNDVIPFESIEDVEKHCVKHNCALFVFFSHNKRRPNNVIFGRLFNKHVMEMYEIGVLSFKLQPDLPGAHTLDHGAVPALLFEGDQWDAELAQFRSVLIDFFVGDLKGHVDLFQVHHAIIFTVVDATILLRHYAVEITGDEPVLTLISPAFDWTVRRSMLPADDVMRSALIKPTVDKKKKNITKDDLGRELGRVFVGRQNVGGLRMKRFTGLHKKRDALNYEPRIFPLGICGKLPLAMS
jgi:ribosome production factor 2